MTDNSPKAVYLRMLDAYNDGTPESYGSLKFLDHFSDDVVIDFPAMVGSPARRGGKELFADGIAALEGVWTNRHSILHELHVDGDRVVARLSWTASTAVETPDGPAGTVLHNDYVDFCTVRDGSIVEYAMVAGPVLSEEGGAA